MTDEEWQKLIERMHSPEVEEAKARYTDEPEPERPGEAVQAEQMETEGIWHGKSF